jgi:SnoaL-like domain
VAGTITSERQIENLIATYSFLVDGGNFEQLGELLADCKLTLGGGPAVTGKEAIATLAKAALMVYEDGTPHTRHITTNLLIEVDESAGTARSQSYYTVLQSLEDFPLQPIATGSYHDRFERRDGIWRFAERSVQTRFAGDVSHHRRASKP